MSASIPALLRCRLRKCCAVAMVGFAVLIIRGSSSATDLGGLFTSKLDAINLAVRSGEWESYVTGYAWHLPWAYRDVTRARLNETTWGGGFGRSVTDGDGDRHSVFIFGFEDSHRALQITAGYGWQRYWPMGAGMDVGLGYVAFVFSRDDVDHHIPLPAALPVASIRYRRCELLGLFVPRVSKDIKGDVLFFYVRIPLGGESGRAKRRG